MSEFVLSCTSPVDLTKEQLTQRDVKYICFKYQLGDEVYTDNFGESMSYTEFYQKMVDGAQTKSV